MTPPTEARSFTTKTTSRSAGEQFSRGLVAYAIAAAVVLIAAGVLTFFYTPVDADQGFRQKIFYLHVPMAIVTLAGFIAGGAMAIKFLRTEDPAWDLRSYVAIHLSLILGVGVLITGAIWAKTSWGTWWEWKEPTLVSFLIVFLLYAIYQPMRFSIDDPGRQSRFAAVYAIIAGAFVPLNFLAVRLADPLIHPRVLSSTGDGLTAEMRVSFYAALIGFGLLWIALWKFELTAKSISMQLSKLKAEQSS